MSALLFVASLLALMALARPASPADSPCASKTVEVGIASAKGCWQSKAIAGGTRFEARFAEQPGGMVDLNGFLIGSDKASKASGAGLVIDESQHLVKSTGKVQIYSRGYPTSGLTPIGGPTELGFTVPPDGEVTIDTLRFGSDSPWVKSIAGLIPATTIENPVTITEGGAGSIDMTLGLTGIFTLKGKPQSVTIALPTKVGEGTKFDGFEFEVNEIDGLKFVTLSNLTAYYKKSENSFGGDVSVVFPFFGSKTGEGERGFSAGFGVRDGRLSKLSFAVSGLNIPLGPAPPGGYLKSIGGGIKFEKDENLLEAKAGFSLGKPIDLPWAKQVTPVGVDTAMKVGVKNGAFVFRLDGGATIFNMPIGSAYLGIYSDAGVEFGGKVGIGLPSFKNNRNDPFYIGAGMDGWIAGHGFQLEGWGQISLFGYNALSGRVLISNKAIGACAKIWRWDLGAVYVYGSGTKFGWSCGIDRYKQKFRASSSASASAIRAQSIRLGPNEFIVKVKGDGAAPRFRMVADDGRSFVPPTGRDGVIHEAQGYGFFVDEAHRETNVVLRQPKGDWKILPLADSAPIIGVSAARSLPDEKVSAGISGGGQHRVLRWSSTGSPHTRLLFTELMPGGVERPIVNTGKAEGRIRFKAATGFYGKRRLKVDVLQRGMLRDTKILASYVVRRPSRRAAPHRVRATRSGGKVTVSWSGVKGATGYLVRASIPAKSRNGKQKVSFADIVGPKARRLSFDDFPLAEKASAVVQALGPDGRLGRAGRSHFLTQPRAETIRGALKRSASSMKRSRRAVRLTTICPGDGVHCLVEITIKRDGSVLMKRSFQQAPGTFHRVKLHNPAIRRHRSEPLKARLTIRHVGSKPVTRVRHLR